jgi:hypothetical protein
LSKDLSVSDLSVKTQKTPSQQPEKHHQPTPFSHARIKKLKDHFSKAQSNADDKTVDAGDDRDSVGNNTNLRSLDNSEKTAPTDNTSHNRLGQKAQSVPTTKIIEDIIRTLEKNVQKRKKIEQRKMKKRREKSSRSLAVSECNDHSPQSQPSLDTIDKEKKRRIKTKGKDRIPKTIIQVEVPVERMASKDTKSASPEPDDPEKLERRQRLKEKLAGSLERIEELIDQRLSNRAERSLNILERADSDSSHTISTMDSSEFVSSAATSAPHADESKRIKERLSSVSLDSSWNENSTRSPRTRKREQVTALPKRSPCTPNANHTSPREVCRGTPSVEMTPNGPRSTGSRVILPDVYKTYTVRTKDLPLTSPTPYSRAPRSNTSWKSPMASNPKHRVTPKGKSGSSSSLANFLDDIQDLLLDDLYSAGSAMDDRSNYSVPMTVVQDHPSNKSREKSSTETQDSSEEDSDDMLTQFVWSSSSNPAAPHRRQARETFWDDYRKSRVPITERPHGTKRVKHAPGEREPKQSCAIRQASSRGLHDELLAKRSKLPAAGTRKGSQANNPNFLHEIQHELRRRQFEIPN